MTGPKRTADQREIDLADLARRYCRGELQSAMADALGVTQQQISHDLRILRARWAESLANFSTRKSEELAKIDHLEATYWAAWLTSTETREITTTEKTQGTTTVEKKKTGAEHLKAAKRTEQRDGNPAFLSGVQWCITKRCELLGLNAPTKIAPTDPTGEHPYEQLSDEALERRIRERLGR